MCLAVRSKVKKIGWARIRIMCLAVRSKVKKIGWDRIGIMCLSGATWLPADCCFSELAP